ncbi:MAG: pilus assembly protein [Alphaproteobacteria bacterium]|nr:pilus assembly protein [Alphaproteobacteria bacterium]
MALLFGKMILPHNRRRRAVTAVEFALIAPVFFLFFIGVIEMSLILLTQHLMENATFNASRLAKTGYIAEGKTQMETVMELLLREMGSLAPLVDVSKLSVTSLAYGSLSQIGQPEQGTEGLGAKEQVVVYTISYPWRLFTPLMSDILGDANSQMNLTSRIVVRNEPYG